MLVLVWLLFVLPFLIMGAMLSGAWIYYAGIRGQSPGMSAPKFSFSRRNGQAERVSADRLPEV